MELNARVKEALSRTTIMALGTMGDDGSWVSPVEYEHDEKLVLYFLSMMDTKHVANILRDYRVSVAIYSHPGPPGGNMGLQIRGRAKHLAAESEGEGGWQRFQITPAEVWCFDSRVFGTSRQRVDLTHLRIK